MWALGAGGAVDAGEDPALALGRELQEEWSVEPERLAVEALLRDARRHGDADRPGLARPGEVTRDHEHDAHAWWPATRAGQKSHIRNFGDGNVVAGLPVTHAWWPRDPAEWPEEAHPQLRRLATLLIRRSRMSFRTLKYLSFTHSAIYTALLVLAIAGAADDAKYVLGWAHGIGWIVMSLLCIDAVRRRVIPLWLGVMVAVVGGVGPFAGTVGFLYAERRADVRLHDSPNAIWSRTLIWQ